MDWFYFKEFIVKFLKIYYNDYIVENIYVVKYKRRKRLYFYNFRIF